MLPSGALRVRVCAGIDPITKRRHDLVEIVPAGMPNAAKEAEKIRTRFLNEIDERRNPRTNATVGQLLDRYLGRFRGAPSTLEEYRGLKKKHIDQFLTHIKVGALDADTLDGW